jgi:type II secretory pathway component GspD/PulD (secretin)
MLGMLLVLAGVTAGDGGLPRCEPDVCLPLKYVDAARVARKLTAALGRGNAVVYSEQRTNRILVWGSAETARRAREIIRRLDVNNDGCLYIVALKKVDAARAVRGLRIGLRLLKLLGDEREVHVTADERANAVILSAGEGQAAAIKQLLRWVDGLGR